MTVFAIGRRARDFRIDPMLSWGGDSSVLRATAIRSRQACSASLQRMDVGQLEKD